MVNCSIIDTKFGAQELNFSLFYLYPANFITIDATVTRIYPYEIGWFREGDRQTDIETQRHGDRERNRERRRESEREREKET